MKGLLVIDMLRDFLAEGGALFCGKESREIIPFVDRKIKEAHRAGQLVIYICDSHPEDDLEFKLFPKHCLEGTDGANIIEELEVLNRDVLIKKRRYSGFFETQLPHFASFHLALRRKSLKKCR